MSYNSRLHVIQNRRIGPRIDPWNVKKNELIRLKYNKKPKPTECPKKLAKKHSTVQAPVHHKPVGYAFKKTGDAVAGAGGFEPPHGGIKIHCLTAWRRPIKPLSGRTIVGTERACNGELAFLVKSSPDSRSKITAQRETPYVCSIGTSKIGQKMNPDFDLCQRAVPTQSIDSL